MGLGVHNTLDPLCEVGQRERASWLEAVDAAVEAGEDLLVAILTTDPRNAS